LTLLLLLELLLADALLVVCLLTVLLPLLQKSEGLHQA
jgi:hypothetical protein